MKRISKLVLGSFLAAAVAVSFTACSLSSDSESDDYKGYRWNDGDKSKQISQMNNDEKKKLAEDYLENIDENPSDYNIGTFSQYSNNNFGAQSAYNCSVTKDDGEEFQIWFESDGKTIDTRFLQDLRPEIESYLAEKINKVYPDGRVVADIGVHSIPSKEWKVSDGVKNYLESDDDYNLFVYIISPTGTEATQADADAVKDILSKYNSVSYGFATLDNPDDFTLDDVHGTDFAFQDLISN